ncbi:MAG: OBAP family protein [Steroidobacteraceae bacterium]|nr:OBAP family protein [Steroidobacteraceae bacterium]
MKASLVLSVVSGLTLGACTGGDTAGPSTRPPGASESTKTSVLEAGAAVLQNNGPLAKMDIHLSGFHPMKLHPQQQMEAHHFCRQVNEDFAQCALFDGDGIDANLNGIEYIISEKLFEQLPAQERQYWHPHNAEILSGQLVAPNLPKVAEKALMRSKMNSYGKTWHTWHSRHGVQPGDRLPMGPAMLAWSFNRDGEAQPGMIAERDQRMDISSAELRNDRKDLVALAKPQEGVDALREHFPSANPIPGVTAKVGTPVTSEANDPSQARSPTP